MERFGSIGNLLSCLWTFLSTHQDDALTDTEARMIPSISPEVVRLPPKTFLSKSMADSPTTLKETILTVGGNTHW